MDRLSIAVATVLGMGFIPWAPGTFGSAAGLLLPLLVGTTGPVPLLLFPLLCLAVIPAVARCGRLLGCTDASAIVVDEVMGQWISLLLVPRAWWTFLLAFLLFRLFDILKPFPVGWLERRVPGAWGVMADDLAAGLLANGVLQVILKLTVLHG